MPAPTRLISEPDQVTATSSDQSNNSQIINERANDARQPTVGKQLNPRKQALVALGRSRRARLMQMIGRTIAEAMRGSDNTGAPKNAHEHL